LIARAIAPRSEATRSLAIWRAAPLAAAGRQFHRWRWRHSPWRSRHLVGSSKHIGHREVVWVAQVPGANRWRIAQPCHHGDSGFGRGARVGSAGMARARRLWLAIRPSSLGGSRGIGRHHWIQVQASCWPPAQQRTQAPRATASRQGARPSQQLLGAAAPETKGRRRNARPGQATPGGWPGVQPCRSDCGRSLSGARCPLR